MEELERALGRAQSWSSELETVVRARANLTRSTLTVSLLAAGAIVLLVGLISPRLTGGTMVRSTAPTLGAPILLIGLALVAARSELSSGWWTGLAVTIMAFIAGSVYVNGSIALVLSLSMLSAVHLILRPGAALALCLTTLGLVGVALRWTTAPVDALVALRSIGGWTIMVVLMQVLMRHVARVNGSAARLSGEIGAEVQRLSAELSEAQRETERRAQLDAATGVRSERAIALLLESSAPPATLLASHSGVADAASAALPPSRVPVVAVRFTRWDEALLSLDAEQRLALQAMLGARLREVFGPDAIVGRRSAAEFLALLPSDRAEQANLSTLRALQERLDRPMPIAGQGVVLSPVIGVAVWPDDAPTLRAVVADAEVARAVAARAAVREPVRYLPRLRQQLATRAELASQILDGIAAGEFLMHYQPIVSAGEGRVWKAEALLRWNHPVLGLISPGRFLDVAEERGLLRALTDWIGAQVVADLQQLGGRVDPAFRIAVNVPPEVLVWWAEDPMGLIAKAQGIGLVAERLVLEVTEDAFVNPSPGVLRILETARAAGARVAIDDFGTGYSSLGRLTALPVDVVKIDRSLIEGLDGDAKRTAIVKAIVGLARDLRLEVVAEGVERPEEARALAAVGCDTSQGFIHSPGVEASDLPEAIRRIEARLAGPVAHPEPLPSS